MVAVRQWRNVDKQPDSLDSLFGAQPDETPAALAAALAPPAAAGHYDELRGGVSAPLDETPAAPKSVAPHALPVRAWGRFFENLGREGFNDLNRRTHNLERQVRDNGVTYNVYADAHGPQRPWSLDLFPLVITPQSWQQLETGVLQRVKLLDRVMADVYGEQTLLAKNLLPPALVHGHPGYLRPMHGVRPAGGTHLHIAAFDMARDPHGDWWVVSQRTQAPSGLGYLLENRLITSRLFPEAFGDLRVQRLAASYRALVDGLKQMCPTTDDPHIVLLTPGPYNETYFEHAYLARYLGLTLVEGSDLTVRDQRLYLKTLKGLEPVHGILKRLDDEFLDPLELRSDSRLGVPGLLQAIRAGNVLVANAPGSAFLESTAMLGFLPALSRHLLGEELQLPSLATWWCGERAAMEAVLPRLRESVIKPTYAGAGAGAVLGKSLSRRELDEWAGRIVRESEDYTVQAYLPLSQMPTWKSASIIPGARGANRIVPRSLMLRVFAVSDGPQSWRVLPGGLTRIASAELEIASMQRGGSSADTWVMTDGVVDPTSLLQHEQPAASMSHRARSATSRAAENLFWLGRYTERTENTTRLARVALESLNGEDQTSQPLLAWLGELATAHALVLPAVPAPTHARRVFERSLIAALAGPDHASVGYNLSALRNAASAVRERLSQEQWNVIVRAEKEFLESCAASAEDGDYSSVEALRVLEALSEHTATMTGAQTDRMTRDDGWRLLSSGRHLERLAFLSSVLAHAFETGSVFDEGGFEALVSLFDSTITFHAQYQQRHDITALLDLLVLDRDNPRSLGWVAQTLRGRLAKLAGSAPGKLPEIALTVPNPQEWALETICERDADGNYANLLDLLQQCTDAAYSLSDDLSARYFTHSGESRHSVGV
ncbi:MAG: circularly permuted type 2 ATP-grasp protein [Burkholderiales bacterium]|nr:circularly permuted type 2 ATP-grasp protein [Burkholderiales bacterium]